MAKTQLDAPAEKVALYDALIDSNSQVIRKGASLHTSLNGNIFSFLDEIGVLNLRLGKEDRDAFLIEFDTRLSIQYNTLMTEYVVVPDALLRDTPALIKYFDLSFHYASSLEPKPTP